MFYDEFNFLVKNNILSDGIGDQRYLKSSNCYVPAENKAAMSLFASLGQDDVWALSGISFAR